MKLKQIRKIYQNQNGDVEALKGITLTLENNGMTMILGPSGCGKTTLMNILAGRLSYEGTIEDIPAFDYLTQDFNLFDHMSVMDNLLLVREDRELIEQYLKDFSLEEVKDRKTKKLSNGQKKRVQFIRALLHEPALLLCDEPTAALDHENTVLLMEELKKRADTTQIVFVTHDTALAQEYADRVIVMDRGRVVQDTVIHEGPLAGNGQQIRKKGVKETVRLACRRIMSSLTDSLIQMVLVVLAVLSVFGMVSLRINITSQSDYSETFKNAENMVVSVPKVSKKNTGETYSGYAVKYDDIAYSDLFSFPEIQNVIENNPEIIGVESFNSYQYQQDYRLEEARSADDEKAYRSFTFMGNEYPDYPLESPFIIRSDFEPYEDWDEYVAKEYKDYTSTLVAAFDLVNGYEDLPLIAGEMPEDDSVILSRNAADILMGIDGYTDYEQMIGKTMTLALRGYENSGYYMMEDTWPITLLEVKIAAVSNVENDFMTMVFFNSGYGNNPIYDYYVEDTDYMKLQYVRFILEPGCDYEIVAANIDNTLHKDNIDITVFQGQGLGKDVKLYQSSEGLTVYGILIIAIVLCLLAVYAASGRKRMKKEMTIMHVYGYSPIQERIIRLTLVCAVSSLLALAVFDPLSSLINRIASSNYYQPFLSMNIPVFVLICLCVWIVMIVLETAVTGGMHHD